MYGVLFCFIWFGFVVLEAEPGVLQRPGKHSTTELSPQPSTYGFNHSLQTQET